MSITDEDQRLDIVHTILKLQQFQHPLIHLAVGTTEKDDCAVYDFPGGLSLLVGSDFIRGPGFKLFQEGLLNFYDLGYYLVVANLSDIAAMGGTPIGLTTIVRYKKTLEDAEFARLFEGMRDAAASYETPIVGGDIGGYEETVLAATAFGVAKRGKYLRRQGTRVEDALCLLGKPGLPGTALAYFTGARKAGFRLSGEEEQELLASWRRPVAQIPEGKVLATLDIVHACQDVSDGVKATVEQLAQASAVSFELFESRIPIHPITEKVATFLKIDPLALAFSASVDFNLMFTIAQDQKEVLQETFKEARKKAPQETFAELFILGIAVPQSQPSYIISRANERRPLPGTAWKQQTTDVTEVITTENVGKG